MRNKPTPTKTEIKQRIKERKEKRRETIKEWYMKHKLLKAYR